MATRRSKGAKLEKNVMDFIFKCSKGIGRFEEEKASQIIWCECQELGMESPIEQILYCAVNR